MPMSFKDWYENQWLPDYHKRFNSVQEFVNKLDFAIAENKRIGEKVCDIVGNGEKGIIDKKIEESENRIKEVVKDSIAEAFETRDKAWRGIWDTRLWMLIFILLQFALKYIPSQ